jgi:glyoxylase-like metal-dependent hydrolase (beta-lactamase superfamily II)
MVEATIDVLARGGFECDLNYLVEGNTLGSLQEPNPDTDFEWNAVYNLVIDHPDGTMLWDTGIHHDAADGHWPDGMYEAYVAKEAADHRLDDDLEAAGYTLEDIEYVFQTHLHSDHAGGLEFFDGTDVPVFVHEEELKWAFFSAKSDAGNAGYIDQDFDHDLNWRIIRGQREQHFEDIEFIHLPGHTPGVLGLMIHLDDVGTIVFASDEVYREVNYVDEVPLGAGLLWNKQRWLDSLNRLKNIRRRNDAEIIYGHDPDQFEVIKNGWP